MFHGKIMTLIYTLILLYFGKDNYVSKNMDWWWLIDIKLYFSCITDSFRDMNKIILSEVNKDMYAC